MGLRDPDLTEKMTAIQEVAIPGLLLRFLDRASLAYAGTRDRQMTPQFHWVCGWRAESDPTRLSVFVAAPFEARLLRAVAECPRLAVTVECIGPHETYQFKGDYHESRPPSPADLAAFEACRRRFVRDVQQIETRFQFPAALLERYLGVPALTVTLKVHEIFLQTPGPGAGQRLVPAEKR